MRTFEYIKESDDGEWRPSKWSPYIWPGSDQLMSWESVGLVIVGAIYVLWWGMDDLAVWDALMVNP